MYSPIVLPSKTKVISLSSLCADTGRIFDAGFTSREVEGEGVVGQQPVLEPGQTHQYVSGCNLKSGIGKMMGTYQMERVVDGVRMDVLIPEFTMIAPVRLN